MVVPISQMRTLRLRERKLAACKPSWQTSPSHAGWSSLTYCPGWPKVDLTKCPSGVREPLFLPRGPGRGTYSPLHRRGDRLESGLPRATAWAQQDSVTAKLRRWVAIHASLVRGGGMPGPPGRSGKAKTDGSSWRGVGRLWRCCPGDTGGGVHSGSQVALCPRVQRRPAALSTSPGLIHLRDRKMCGPANAQRQP